MATQYYRPDAAPQAVVPPPQVDRDQRYLFNPVVDFLCLGGSSLIILPLILMMPVAGYQEQVAGTMLIIAHLINHPHFAHSYQIFYRGFRIKAFTADLGRAMQVRYVFSGIVIPAMLAAFFAFCLLTADARLLGYAANVMALFVGWHYVKQGYGMLMVDAALKRQYFNASEKKVLLVNCYAVWVAAWLGFNDAIHERKLWGLQYFTFDFPDPIVIVSTVVAAATGIAAVGMLATRWRSTGRLPVNGVIAYAVSLYIWLWFVTVHPLWLLVAPALHSLQYLVVVWRFQTNYQKAQLAASEPEASSLARRLVGNKLLGHLILFTLSGVILGFVGFWGLPIMLNATIPYDDAVFGSTLFLFVGWIFINVHHYFLDTVMWRRENPDTRQYLFG